MEKNLNDLDNSPDDKYDVLYKRIHQQKMQELFQEPSTFEDEDDIY